MGCSYSIKPCSMTASFHRPVSHVKELQQGCLLSLQVAFIKLRHHHNSLKKTRQTLDKGTIPCYSTCSYRLKDNATVPNEFIILKTDKKKRFSQYWLSVKSLTSIKYVLVLISWCFLKVVHRIVWKAKYPGICTWLSKKKSHPCVSNYFLPKLVFWRKWQHQTATFINFLLSSHGSSMYSLGLYSTSDVFWHWWACHVTFRYFMITWPLHRDDICLFWQRRTRTLQLLSLSFTTICGAYCKTVLAHIQWANLLHVIRSWW